jgi:putative endonuclease
MAIQQEHGKVGEYLAVKWLRRQGYEIHSLNWRGGHQEIDIIATEGRKWIFIEVKTKTFTNFLQPENSVNSDKRKNLIIGARKFLSKVNDNKQIRFDVISILLVPYGVQMTHFKDAFFPIQTTNFRRNSSRFLKHYI